MRLASLYLSLALVLASLASLAATQAHARVRPLGALEGGSPDETEKVSKELGEILRSKSLGIHFSEKSLASLRCTGAARESLLALAVSRGREDVIAELAVQALGPALSALAELGLAKRRMHLATDPELAFAREYYRDRKIEFPDAPVILRDDAGMEQLGGIFSPIVIQDEVRPGMADVEVRAEDPGYADCVGTGDRFRLRLEAFGSHAEQALASWAKEHIGGTGILTLNEKEWGTNPLSRSVVIHELRHYADFLADPSSEIQETFRLDEERAGAEFDTGLEKLRSEFKQIRANPRYDDFVKMLEQAASMMPIVPVEGQELDLAWEGFRASVRNQYLYLLHRVEISAFREELRYLRSQGRPAMEQLVERANPRRGSVPISGKVQEIELPRVSIIDSVWAARVEEALK